MGECFSWLKHNHKFGVGTYKQQPYPYRSSATKFQSNFHIPVHFVETEPIPWILERFGAVRHQDDQFEAFQSHFGLIETLGFHLEKIRRVFILFGPFCVHSNPIQCISEPFELIWSRFEPFSIHSFVLSYFVVKPICFVPFRAILYSFHLFPSCRFVVELC